MARSLLALTVLLLGSGSALAQIDPPIVNRPVDFSNIVGEYKMHITATPTEVRVEEPITLRVSIIGNGPKKYEPNRKDLKLLPESFTRDFFVQEIRDEHHVDPKTKTWLFVYRLKPKHEKIDAIDGITLVYYNPNHPGKNKFVTVFADAIPIQVKPIADALDPTIDVAAVPESFYTAADSREVLARTSPLSISGVQLAIALALPPLLCLAGAVAWRRWYGDDAQRARQTRGIVARHLVQRLQVNTAPWKLVREYLEEGFGFSAQDATPAEVAAFLKRRGFAKPVCEMARAFFQQCDAERFAPTKATPHVSEEAARLIEALEADPCARG